MSKWSRRPPAHKRNVKPCLFICATWIPNGHGGNSGHWDYDLYEIKWFEDYEEGGYWQLLSSRGEEAGCIVDDFPTADWYCVVDSRKDKSDDR